MRSRYIILLILITALGLTLLACQTDQDAVPTEAPAIPTATSEAPAQSDYPEPAAGEEEYPAPAEQQTLPTPESYPEPTEDGS